MIIRPRTPHIWIPKPKFCSMLIATVTGLGSAGGSGQTTWNPSDKNAGITLSDGDRVATNSAGSDGYVALRAVAGKSSGKWCYQVTKTTIGSASNGFGIATSSAALNNYIGSEAASWGVFAGVFNNNALVIDYSATWSSGDYGMVAVDFGASKLWFGKNGTWFNSGDPAAGTNAATSSLAAGTWYPAANLFNPGDVYTIPASISFTLPTGFSLWS